MIKATGRKFYVIDGESTATLTAPAETEDFHEWTEMTNDAGVLWYVSDDDMNLTHDEFWGDQTPIEKPYLVCCGCGEAFDEIATAYGHEQTCEAPEYLIAPESQAM